MHGTLHVRYSKVRFESLEKMFFSNIRHAHSRPVRRRNLLLERNSSFATSTGSTFDQLERFEKLLDSIYYRRLEHFPSFIRTGLLIYESMKHLW